MTPPSSGLRSRIIARVAGALITGVFACTAPVAHAAKPGEAACELGIALALNGRAVAAESVFTAVLAMRPGDAAAVNNLGNLQLIAGYPMAALAFYRRAAVADTSDPGIALNEAAALMLLGQSADAESHARGAVARAGGAPAAARLLGLHYGDGADAGRAAEAAPLGREEVLQMLRAATGSVPADSVRSEPAADSTRRRTPDRRKSFWRAAGARADEARTGPTLVYWKR